MEGVFGCFFTSSDVEGMFRENRLNRRARAAIFCNYNGHADKFSTKAAKTALPAREHRMAGVDFGAALD